MLGNIIEIIENNVIVKLQSNIVNLDNIINNYVVIQDKKQQQKNLEMFGHCTQVLGLPCWLRQ